MVLTPYSSRPIYCTRYQHIGMVTNRQIPGFLTNTTTPTQAVWAHSSGCSLRGPHLCYEHPLIASLLIGAAQEADLVSPGFQQSTAISNRSTLDFTLHCGEQRIVLPGDTSWKRLCSSSVPPDNDDEKDRLHYSAKFIIRPTLRNVLWPNWPINKSGSV